MGTNDEAVFLKTRGGLTIKVRSARAEDERVLAEFFTHVTPADLRFRFLSSVRQVPHEQIVAMTHTDHRRTENYLAFSEDGSLLIATAMLACEGSLKHGEVAIAIRSDYKARGIGWTLLHHVAEVAATRGIETIESIESRDNHAAIEVEEDMGFTAMPVEDDATLLCVRKTLIGAGPPA